MRRLVRLVIALAGSGLVTVAGATPQALAKGCQPACDRVEVVRAGEPVRPMVPICWSTDVCWRQAPLGVFAAGEELTVRVFWTDDDGRRQSPPPYVSTVPGYSVFFWRTTADSLTTVGAFEFASNPDLPRIEVPVAPQRDVLVGSVRLAQPGFWIAQERPRGAWPQTPWGTDPIVVQVQPSAATVPLAGVLPSDGPAVLLAAFGVVLLGCLFAVHRARSHVP